jgi:hypothetical protein
MLAVRHMKLKMYVSNDPYENTNWRCMLLGTTAGKYRMVPPVNWQRYGDRSKTFWDKLRENPDRKFTDFYM